MASSGSTIDTIHPTEQPPAIDGYGSGGFRIDGLVHKGSLIVLPTGFAAWDIAAFAQIDDAVLPPSLFADGQIELLLLGCGETMQMVPRGLRDALRAVGTVVEPMGTGAAVRTYNVLLGENRRVAAALIAVD
ncbi:MAG: hypothetical protein GKS02_07165 [Alphaproteobacteria bacterium]|nr:hypothetical protein [Alphaproteobacteria bacterium]